MVDRPTANDRDLLVTVARLFGIAFLENFGHRQIVTFWRVNGIFS